MCILSKNKVFRSYSDRQIALVFTIVSMQLSNVFRIFRFVWTLFHKIIKYINNNNCQYVKTSIENNLFVFVLVKWGIRSKSRSDNITPRTRLLRRDHEENIHAWSVCTQPWSYDNVSTSGWSATWTRKYQIYLYKLKK